MQSFPYCFITFLMKTIAFSDKMHIFAPVKHKNVTKE